MTYTRTITASVPQGGREVAASALLEAPDVDGQPGEFVAIEAANGAVTAFTTRHAAHDPGWYVIQQYDDARVSRFSDPVCLSGGAAAALAGGSTYGGR